MNNKKSYLDKKLLVHFFAGKKQPVK